MIDFRYIYDIILELQEQLEQDHDEPELGHPDYRKIQALAATYILQDYLANTIAELEACGILDLQEEGTVLLQYIWTGSRAASPAFFHLVPKLQ